MRDRFISEAIEPQIETCDTLRMAAGEPGLPRAFRWRGEILDVTTVLRSWRETGPCSHGSRERYVRKHWYEVATAGHGVLTIYFDRQQRPGRKEGRWWLFSMRAAEPGVPGT
jgi:phosphoribosylglycinamide formyltransferase-1